MFLLFILLGVVAVVRPQAYAEEYETGAHEIESDELSKEQGAEGEGLDADDSEHADSPVLAGDSNESDIGEDESESEFSAEGNQEAENVGQPEGAGAVLAPQDESIVASGTWGTCPWEIDVLGKLTIHPGRGANTSGNASPWEDYAEIITTIVISEEDGQKVIAPANCSYLFYNLTIVQTIDASGLDTSHANNMSHMFSGCRMLEVLNAADWHTLYVTQLEYMFKNCSSLVAVDVSSWEVSRVENARGMFYGCASIESIDVSTWKNAMWAQDNGQIYYNLDQMFCGCTSLTDIDISNWSIRSSTSCASLFSGCSSLKRVDISGIRYGSRNYARYGILNGCTSLEEYTVGVTPPFNVNEPSQWPVATASNGKWWSRKAKQWFTVEQISSSRRGIADTYLNYEGIGFDVDVAQAKIIVADQNYTGTAREPLPAVILEGKTLVNGIDYTLSYRDNVNAGTGYVVITGRGDYAGEIAYPFAIAPKPITVRADALSKEWGQDDPELTATVDGLVGEDTVSYSLLREPGDLVGEYVIAVEGDTRQGNYTVSYERSTFTITRATIAIPAPSPLVYNGQEQSIAGDADGYSWSGTMAATNAGSYTACVTPDENHRWADGSVDSKDINWVIGQRSIDGCEIQPVPNQTYTGKAITPSLTVTIDGVTLQAYTDYTVSFSSNTDAGTAHLSVRGIGNYQGTAEGSFTIERAPITAPTAASGLVYNGYVQKGVAAGAGYTLSGTYRAADAGSYQATATPDSNHVWDDGTTEAKKIKWTIAPAKVSAPSVKIGLVYNGTIQNGISADSHVFLTGTVSARDAGNYSVAASLVNNVNYQWSDGTSAQKTIDWSIAPADISSGDVTVDAIPDQTYTGSAIAPSVTVRFKGTVLNPKRTNGAGDYELSYTNNIQAGTATITIKGINNFNKTCTTTFTIARAPLTVAAVEQSKTYGASDPKLRVQVTGAVDDFQPTYTIGRESGENVGTYAITPTGDTEQGNYTITYVPSVFTISAANLSSASVAPIGGPFVYTGVAIAPRTEVTWNGKSLVSGTDYTIAYGSNVNAGTGRFTVTGVGNFTGSANGTFSITAAPIATADVIVANAVYTGSEVRPDVTVAWNDRTLVAGRDYTLEYDNNINVGTGSVTVTGAGNFTGTKGATFTISSEGIVAATIAPIADMTYTGQALTPKPKITYNGVTLKEGVDYALSYRNNTNAGTAVVNITGKGNYGGSTSTAFSIVAASLSDATVRTDAATYTGSALQPAVTVAWNGRSLSQGKDFTVAYGSNVNAGTGHVTVTGIGNFSKSVSGTFQIAPASISGAGIKAPSATYTGSALKPEITVTWNGRTLVAGKDYSTSYSDNVNVGNASVTVTGMGNFTGTGSATFKVLAASISSAIVTAPDVVYTGSAQQPAVTVTVGPNILKLGTDYTVAYSSNVDKGTASITVTGKGNYTGQATGSFRIVSMSINDAAITIAGNNYVYDGNAKTPAVTVTLNNEKLVAGTDYAVTYGSNINAGTAHVTVTGKGNYTGSKAGSFQIDPLSIRSVSVTAPGAQTYTGHDLKPKPTITFNGKTLVEGSDYALSYLNNVNVGTATITITGKGNFTDTTTTNFKIARNKVAVPVAKTDLVYSGTSQQGVPETADYVLSGSVNGTNAGTYKTTVTLANNSLEWTDGSTAPKTVTWTIAPASITSAKVTAPNQTYDGKAHKPNVTVTLKGKRISDTDYTVSYDNAVNAGTATITVAGKNNYKDSVVGTFVIEKLKIAEPAAETGLIYNGKVQRGVAAGAWYALSGTASATNAGSYKANVSLNDTTNCEWSDGTVDPKTIAWYVAQASLASATVTAPIQVYSGSAKTPAITVTLEGHQLVAGTDYTVAYGSNNNAGTAHLSVRGIGNYQGTAKGSFTIERAPISVPTAASGLVYNGYVQTGVATGVGYELSGTYSAMDVGSYQATAELDSNHVWDDGITADKKISWNIASADISSEDVIVDAIPDQAYTGSAIAPSVTVWFLGDVLNPKGTEGAGDYELSYTNNIKAGLATITITGINNFCNSRTATFKIEKPTQSMYRLYNPNSGEHFYTADAAERNNVVRAGWKYEGIGWVAPVNSSMPVYRLYSGTDHHYTMYASERDNLIRAGWKYEGIGWYSDEDKTVPLWREFNPNVDPSAPRNNSGSHNYTTSKSEHDHLCSIGWKDEGIGWYAVEEGRAA
ncbi:MAG: MBG domain-containing protein [Atopobiaceae bacterium]|nr:MBG domain-containing protein [Atopobiaceae bacterium]